MSDSISAKQLEIADFAEGDLLFEENETSFHFYIVQEGEVEIFKAGPSGDIILARVGPGGSIGEFAMLDRKPRSASARALTAVTVARLSPDAYEELVSELPAWAVAVMRALVERLRFTNEIVRNAQKSKNGVLNSQDQDALSAAEFASKEAHIRRINDAEKQVEHPDEEFDFSVYDTSNPKSVKKP